MSGHMKAEQITAKQCLRIRAAYDAGVERTEIAKRFGICRNTVTACGQRRCKHQEDQDGH